MELTSEQLDLLSKLTPLQKAVCMNIFNGMTDVGAYLNERPDMSEKSAAAAVSRMLKNKKVVDFISSIRKIQSTTVVTEANMQSAVMSRQEVIERLTAMSRCKLSDVMTIELVERKDKETGAGTGEYYPYPVLKDPKDIPPHAMDMILTMSTSQGGLTVKMQDQNKAMAMLVKMQGYDIPEPTENEVLTPWSNLKGCED